MKYSNIKNFSVLQDTCRGLLLTGVVVFTDLFIKYVVLENFIFEESKTIGLHFNIQLVFNHRALFGILPENPEWGRLYVMLLGAFFISGFYLWWCSLSRTHRLEKIGIILALGGVLGNMIDLVYRGYVVDFIALSGENWQLPIFNVADMGICIGALFIVISLLQNNNKS